MADVGVSEARTIVRLGPAMDNPTVYVYEHENISQFGLFNCPAAFPSGASVAAAYLHFYCSEREAFTESWTLRWQRPPEWSVDALPTWFELLAGDVVSPSFDVADIAVGWNVVDVTALVQSWIGDVATGIALVADPDPLYEHGYCNIYSPRAPALRPYWTIHYGGGGGGGDGPDVEIITPVAGAIISGAIVIRAQISDDVGVLYAEAYIDGVSIGALAVGGTMWTWTTDLGRWINGEHTITVRAWDADGNMGEDSITVTVANSMAAATRIIYTKQMQGDIGNWREDGFCDLALEVMDVDRDALPASPGQRYNLDVYAAAPGAAAEVDEMVPVTPNVSHGFAAQSPFCRWAIRARPQQVLTSWEPGAADVLRLGADGDSVLALTSAPEVARLVGDAFETVADLAGYGTPTDFEIWNGRIVVCCGSQLVFWDPDSGEEPWVMEPPAGTTGFDVVESQGGNLYIGARVDESAGKLLRLSSEYDLVDVATIERVTALRDCEASLAVGCVDGTIYSYAGILTELYDAGADAIARLSVVGGEVLAGAGSAVHRNQPAWAADYEFAGITDVRALGAAGDHTYGGGAGSDIVWLREVAGAWLQVFSLEGATDVNDMLTLDDVLYIATSGDTDGRLWRLEVSAGSGLVCGPERPDFRFKLLRRRGA